MNASEIQDLAEQLLKKLQEASSAHTTVVHDNKPINQGAFDERVREAKDLVNKIATAASKETQAKEDEPDEEDA